MFTKFIQFLKNLVASHRRGTWAQPPPIPMSSSAMPPAGSGVTPRHRQINGYVFSEILNNQVDNTIDTVSLDGATLEVNHQQQYVITANHHVVRPSHVVACCEVCGRYSELIVHCDRCSLSVCFKHSAGVDTPQGILCLCPKCQSDVLVKWNTWPDKPEYRFPRPPVATAKLFAPKGSKHEDANGTNH